LRSRPTAYIRKSDEKTDLKTDCSDVVVATKAKMRNVAPAAYNGR